MTCVCSEQLLANKHSEFCEFYNMSNPLQYAGSLQQLPQSLTTYLTKWLEVATKGNVKFVSRGIGRPQSFLVFKCRHCGDNWHVGDHLFFGPNGEYIPSELQDWVKEHRHVCKKYVNDFPETLQANCKKCNWPYGAHEESWLKDSAAIQLYNQKFKAQQNVANDPGYQKYLALQQMHYSADNNLTGWNFIPKPAPEPEKPKPIPPLPEPKGRKFR